MSTLLTAVTDQATTLAVRAALIGGSLASGSLFWVRATLGQNQLEMHDCSKDGAISIGGVSEQLYGEGFIAAYHEVLGREFGPRLPQVLYEIGLKGARWEVKKAFEMGVWVPKLLRSFVGRPELLQKVKTSPFYHALMQETLRILFRMIMTEGGWGVVEDVDLRSTPIKVRVKNTPEPRRLGHTGQCSCHLATGIYAGYVETIFGLPVALAKETACRSRGDAVCTFEVTFGSVNAAEEAAKAAATDKPSAGRPSEKREPVGATK